MPRFSVVIPAYNAKATIPATIRSVLTQTERDFELIVVDDGSADGTPEVVEGFADPRIQLVRQQNSGTAGARNTGIALAEAEYVSFLDNDDLWMPEYLSTMGIALDAHPQAGFAYCDGWGLDHDSLRVNRYGELHYRSAPAPGATWEQTLLVLTAANFVMSSATVRREVLADLEGFDTTVRGTDDYDLWMRILLSGRTAVQAGDAPLLLQRGRHDSQSKDERMMLVGLRLVLQRAADSDAMPPAPREVALRRIDEIDGLLAGPGRPTGGSLARSLRSRAVALRNRVLRAHYWPSDPPPEVARAFPELRPERR